MAYDRIGFFHFVHNHTEPILELRKALESQNQKRCICDSLIVLPEAFNVGKCYKASGSSDYDPGILSEIQSLSRTFQVTIIAGLIIKQPGGPNPPYSSAYLVDETCIILVSRKRTSDGNEHNTPYSTWQGQNDHQNPIWHNSTCLISLICIDSDNASRKNALLDTFRDTPKIICIPASMGRPSGCAAIASNWAPHDVILANSDPNGIGSFVSRAGNIIVGESGVINKIVLV